MSCGIIAHEAKKLPEYFSIVKRAFENLPPEIKPTTKTDTKYMYEFVRRFDGAPLDSSIYVATDIRGGTVRKLHITEIAYIKDLQRIKTGSKQAVPLDGTISEETTANGFGEWYDDYEEARNNVSPDPQDYKAYFYPWIDNPEYTLPGLIEAYDAEELKIKKIASEVYGAIVTDGQLLWRRWKMRELQTKQEGVGLSTIQQFRQEYPLTASEAFQSGAGNIFDIEKIDATQTPPPLTYEQAFERLVNMWGVEEGTKKATEFKRLNMLGVVMWDVPTPNRKYVGGVDPSDGEGADFGVIDIWDDEAIAQVAQFYGKKRPDVLAEIAAAMGNYYNTAFVGVENNMLSCVLFFSKIYTNYYMVIKIDKKTQERTRTLGWSTNTATRDVMIDDFIKLHDEDNLKIRSTITLKEMKTFVKKAMPSGTYKREHANGKFDDSLFAGFIAIQMRKYNKPRARVLANKPSGF